MAGSLSTKVLRVLLVVFDLVLFATGAIMTGFGIYLVIASKTYSATGQMQAIPIAFLVLGLLVLLTSFFGCCGALKMNRCFLLLFALLVALIVVGEIVCAVVLLVNKNKFRPYIRNYFLNAITEIQNNENPSLEQTIRYLQDEMDCCGANGPSDWKQPNISCCDDGRSYCLFYPQMGCVDAVYHEMREGIVGVGAVVIVLAVLELYSAWRLFNATEAHFCDLKVCTESSSFSQGALPIHIVAGALLIGSGVYIAVRTVQSGLIVAIYGLPTSTLALGLVVLTAAFIGCFGACNLNGCLIKWYAILMVLLVVGEIICGTLLFALKNQSVELIQQYFNSSIHKIESGIGGPQLLNSIRRIQTRLDCCGAYGPGDWKDPYEFCCRSGRLCFRTPQLVRFTSVQLTRSLALRSSRLIPPLQGCVQAADEVLTEGRLPLGITIIVLGVIELGAVVCAAFLARRIRQIGSNTAPLT
ncbi:unnamed protein product [Taenia asiatica]|uniref:Tetraspanin n=1 Tax=Taenia asiatica TaxID=60517 RepID=A0A0R3WAY2_TAEAS|nr:unnamed protein product [Taenia asiatica]